MFWSISLLNASDILRYIYILSCRMHSIYCDIFCPVERLRYMTCRLTSDTSIKEFHHYFVHTREIQVSVSEEFLDFCNEGAVSIEVLILAVLWCLQFCCPFENVCLFFCLFVSSCFISFFLLFFCICFVFFFFAS